MPLMILLSGALLAKSGATIGVVVGVATLITFLLSVIAVIEKDCLLGTAIGVAELKRNEPVKVLCFCEIGAMDNEAHHRMVIERQDGSIHHLVVWPKEMPPVLRTGWVYQPRDGALVSIRD